MGRFPRRAIVISLILPVLSTLVVGGFCVADLASWFAHSGRATTVVAGQGDPVGGDEPERLDVRWKDATGDVHEAQFRVPEGSGPIPRGQPFQIRYDPADPEGVAFPAGADEDLVIPPAPRWWVLLIALPFLILTASVALGWWIRVRKAGVAAAQPGQRYRVVPFVLQGTQLGFGSVKSVDIGLGTLLFPVDAPFDADAFKAGRGFVRPPAIRWQRVMWSPGFAALEPGQEVTAHFSEEADGRAVLTTDKGTVWPTGRLHDRDLPAKQPALVAFRSPVNSRVRPGAAYLVAPLFGMCAAPSAATSPAILLVIPFALLLGYGVTIAAWAFRSGIPAES